MHEEERNETSMPAGIRQRERQISGSASHASGLRLSHHHWEPVLAESSLSVLQRKVYAMTRHPGRLINHVESAYYSLEGECSARYFASTMYNDLIQVKCRQGNKSRELYR